MENAGRFTQVAVDLGASGGKMAAARFDGERLSLEEYIHFPNTPAELAGTLYWDIFGLYKHILEGLSTYAAQGVHANTIGVDTWGASYGFLDAKGRLLEPVYHYRDKRTQHVMEPLFGQVSQRELFRLTGCQCNRTYTLPQLYACVLEKNPCLQNAHQLLFLPDLLGYFLSGVAAGETTIAGTSALLNTSQTGWEPEVFRRFDIPGRFAAPLVPPGTVKGPLLESVANTAGHQNARVVATIGHDSAAAVAAIPNFGPGKLYISIGTNISMGIERAAPLVGDDAFAGGLKNTGGMDGTVIVYRDFPAFWLVNEIKAALAAEGRPHSYDEMQALAAGTASAHAFINTEHPSFNIPGGDMRGKINAFLAGSGQPQLCENSGFIRCVFESLILKVMHVASVLQQCSGVPLTEAFVVNGGGRNSLLVQMISDALQLPVHAGMPYATLAGNLLCQLQGGGLAKGLAEMRGIAKNTFAMKAFEPGPAHAEFWREQLCLAREKGLV